MLGRRGKTACPTCGAQPPRSARFCAECGTRLAEDDSTTAVAPAPAPAAGRATPRVGGALRSARERAGYAVESLAVRSRASRGLGRARAELLTLSGERDRLLRALGDAVYREDAEGTRRHRDELAELDARIERKEAEMATIVAEAQERIERARLEIQPTVMVEVPEPPSPGPAPEPPMPGLDPAPPTPVPEPYPPPDEATPPEPARIPEPGPLGEQRDEK